jgi:phospholipid/cholesterol/gamma-HCH transport system ATP-binding protein
MIEIMDLHKEFDGHQVLDGVNLKINTGETTVIIGRSGCGKSVLLKHIIGIMKPDSGKIVIDGKDVTKMDEKELNLLRLQFGMLFQGAALFDSLNVLENVGFGMIEHSDTKRDAIAKRVTECLALVGLKGIEQKKPAELSGGMRKRVGLARAIAMRPQIMLYDEPTTGVDPIMGDSINDLIVELHNKLKTTSIAVTHDMTSAYKIADRIAMLYNGKIIISGTPDEIKGSKDPVVRQFITGASKGPITEGIDFEHLI